MARSSANPCLQYMPNTCNTKKNIDQSLPNTPTPLQKPIQIRHRKANPPLMHPSNQLPLQKRNPISRKGSLSPKNQPLQLLYLVQKVSQVRWSAEWLGYLE
ncbi:hypothetical protein L873DRAFT_1804532 [Choiromyces venosus 120613-1]|uniref:Uncharacterized protein n=1 Tax=Choiromyces venosus 120613-1 TaxID=1336337 RepID=A0A3N4JVB5_9PEZI|nr:hypothetical protein L873DRAFT_1804532 [Choiromyces venosus 120613-1]